MRFFRRCCEQGSHLSHRGRARETGGRLCPTLRYHARNPAGPSLKPPAAGEFVQIPCNFRLGQSEAPLRGRLIVKRLPSPILLATTMVPPCASTIPFAIANPKPV